MRDLVRQDDARAAVASRAVGVIAGLAATVASTRLLSPDDRGRYVVALASVSLLTTLLTGVPAAAAQSLQRGEAVGGVLRSARRLTSALALGAAAAVAAGVVVSSGEGWLLLLAASVLPTALLQTSTGLLTARGQALSASLAVLSSQLVLPPLLVVLCLSVARTPTSAAIAWLTSQVVGAVLAHLLARGSAEAGPAPRLLRPAAAIGSIALLSLLNYRAEQLLLDALDGDVSASVYNVASTAAEVVWVVGAAVASTNLGRIVREDREALASRLAPAVRQLWLASFAVAVVIGGTVPFLLEPVLGPPYGDAVVPTEVLLVGCVAFAPASLLGGYFTVARQSARVPMITVVLSAVVTAAGTGLLAPDHGATGAAVGCLAGYVVGTAFLVARFVRVTGCPVPLLVPRTADVRELLSRVSRRAARTP